MAFEDLFNGLKMFNQGVQEYATSKAIGEATDRIAQLNTMQLKDTEMAQQRNAIGQDLALRLQQVGAPQERIQGAAAAAAGPQYSTPEQMIMAGSRFGNQGIMQQGIQAARALNTPHMDITNATNQAHLQAEREKTAGSIAVARIGAGAAGNELTKVDPAEIQFEQSAEASKQMLGQLRDLVKEHDTWATRVTDKPEVLGQMETLPRLIAETYGHVLNPTGIGRENTIKAVNEEINPKAFENRAAYVQKLDQIIKNIETQQAARTRAQQKFGVVPGTPKEGRTVSQVQQASVNPQTGLPPGYTVEWRKSNKDGSMKPVVIDERGQPVGFYGGGSQ